MPTAFLDEETAGRDCTREDLLRVLRAVPVPPPLPTGPGDVLAVVGDPTRARMLAMEIAAETGLSPHQVLMATMEEEIAGVSEERLVDSAGTAATWREELAERSFHSVVAVDAPIGQGRRAWVRHVLSAFDPSLVIGVVEATSKPEDICAWAADIGGVDTLAVEGTMHTCTPGSVLACGLPVALVDGQPATPERWVALVSERLGTAAAIASRRAS